MNFRKAFAGVLVPMLAVLALAEAPALAADPAVAPAGTATAAPTTKPGATKPRMNKPRAYKPRATKPRSRAGGSRWKNMTPAQRQAWLKAHPRKRPPNKPAATPKP